MRPGLVVAGVVFAILGGGALAAVYLAPSPAPTSGEGTTIPSTPVRAGATYSSLIEGPNGSNGMFRLHWSSTVPLEVFLYPSAACVPTETQCGAQRATAEWMNASHGNWSATGSFSYPMLLVWSDPGPIAGTFSANGYASATGSASMLAVSQLLDDAAALVLIVIGALALFLGLFLRGGVYGRLGGRGPPPVG